MAEQVTPNEEREREALPRYLTDAVEEFDAAAQYLGQGDKMRYFERIDRWEKARAALLDAIRQYARARHADAGASDPALDALFADAPDARDAAAWDDTPPPAVAAATPPPESAAVAECGVVGCNKTHPEGWYAAHHTSGTDKAAQGERKEGP